MGRKARVESGLAVLAVVTALGPLSCAGHAEPQSPEGAAGAAGAPSTAGAWGEQAEYGLYVVPLLPPDPLPNGLRADQLNLVGQVHGFNADGSILTGRTDWTYLSEDKTESLSGASWFAWTAKSETVAAPNGLSAEVVTSDGGLWGTRVVANEVRGFGRWALSGDARLFDLDLQASTGSLVEVSQDAKVATGWLLSATGQATALLWRSAEHDDRFEPIAIPGTGAWPELSADGSRLIAVSDGVVYQASTRASSVEPSPIIAPTGYSQCAQAVVSANGSVIAGVCARDANQEGPSTVVFRWTEGDGAVQVIQPGSSLSVVMSRDGNNLLGTVSDAEHPVALSWWTPTDVVEESIWGGVVGLSDDAKVAWVTIVDAMGQNGFEDTTAARWTREGGVVRLDKLHDGSTRVAGYSSTGSLAVGGHEPAYLWDERGARDILAELRAAEVDLKGVTQFAPERVWNGDPIRIQGSCYVGDSTQRVCLVTLPSRN